MWDLALCKPALTFGLHCDWLQKRFTPHEIAPVLSIINAVSRFGLAVRR